MHKLLLGGALALAVLTSGVVAYRLGTGAWPELAELTRSVGPGAADHDNTSGGAHKERAVLYWRDPDGKSDYSPTPTKTADGRDYVPVYQDEEQDFAESKPKPSPKTADGKERKILYYRNPMGLADTSPVPKKDWMGMDYIAVYEGEEEDDGSTVKISLDRVQRSGVRTELAQKRRLVRPVRASGVAKPDERTMHTVTLRADAFIEKLYVEETGAAVKVGQPLFRIYSPDMVNAQVDYRIGLPDSSIRGRRSSLKGAKQKLRNLEVPQAVLDEMLNTGEPVMAFDWPSPANGYVMKKNVIEGQMVRMGDEIFRIAGLENIWIIADVSEQDFGLVAVGQPAKVRFRAFPSEVFEGRVTFILHELGAATRTAKVRIEIDNPQHRIKHEMYADVDIDTTHGDEPRVAVPNSAVIDSGNRQVVIVARGEGRFEPRSVTLGLRGEDYTEIKEGIAAGEEVVVAANFLIDAESNLKAALSSFTADDTSKPKNAAGGMNHSSHDKATPPAEEQHP